VVVSVGGYGARTGVTDVKKAFSIKARKDSGIIRDRMIAATMSASELMPEIHCQSTLMPTFARGLMDRLVLCLLVLCAMMLPALGTGGLRHWTGSSDVIWTSASKDSSGSMPLGNGEVGINLWVEEGGDLLFIISRTDSFSETARLSRLKAARRRVARL